jgi:transposase
MDTTKLFDAALGLTRPWKVESIDFEPPSGGVRGRIDIRIDFERGGALPCPECGKACKAHDADEQRWRHMDFFQHEAWLVARVPRVDCGEHGVLRTRVPWGRAGSGFTLLFEAYVLALAAHVPMRALARLVHEHDTRLWRIVRHHVREARAKARMDGVEAVVVDETSRAKRHSYVTIFLEPRTPERPARVLFATEGRSGGGFALFKRDLQAHGGDPARVGDVCMDMSEAFLGGAREHLPGARITYDRFHVMKLANEALDKVRRAESASRPELRRTRYDWLSNPSSLSPERRGRIESLAGTNLLTAKAWQMRQNLRALWEQDGIGPAAGYLKRWCAWVGRACRRRRGRPWTLAPMHKLARTVREHAQGVLNYFRLRLTSGVVESVNGLAQAARARARGYRNPDTFITMIYLIAGRLRFDLPALAAHSP